MRLNRKISVGMVLLICLAAGNLPGQAIPRDQYLQYLPLEYPRIIEQTKASAALKIFGDEKNPGYVDENPRNGIDDRRDRILLDLAIRFAPYLVQNTTSAPIDFRVYIGRGTSFPLYIDTWNIATPKPELVNADLIDFSSLAGSDCRLDRKAAVPDSSEFDL